MNNRQLIKNLIDEVRRYKWVAKKTDENLRYLYTDLEQKNHKLRNLALTDSLTGLFNYHYLKEYSEIEFERSMRGESPLSAFMIDIDYFKTVNDVYGHIFGDAVLKELASVLKKTVRAYDTVFRFGGEEFTIISPGLDKKQTLVLGKRLLQAVRNMNFGDDSKKVSIKISIGVASFPEDKILTGIGLVGFADRYLKKVKEEGGNGLLAGKNTENILSPDSPDNKLEISAETIKDRLQKLYRRTTVSIIEQITAFANRVNEDDPYFIKHNKIVAKYATTIAKEIKLPGTQIDKIHKAALIHDIGKAGIPKKITLKETKWSVSEFNKFKKHTLMAADILQSTPPLVELIPAVKYHHERWDGKGYPEGLKEDNIPLEARIIGIADAFTALVSDRYHRKAYSIKDAIEILKAGRKTQFDPKLVDAFVETINMSHQSPPSISLKLK